MEKASTIADQDFGAQFLMKRKQRRNRRILVSLVVLGLLGGAYYWQTLQVVETEADQALIVTIGYGDIENAIPAAGSLQPKEIVPVGARASGELVEIYVEVGDMVEEGQALALIDPEEQELRVESSRLSLENQKNQMAQRELALEIAENNLKRTQMLFDANASTEQELENARNSLLSAETNLKNLEISIQQSQTSLDQEEVQLRYTEIKAPLSGTIIEITQKEGATLNASQTAPTVMQIADLAVMTVETEISEADISSLSEGVEVYFTTLGGGDRRWYGELRQIDPMPTTSNNVVLYKGKFDVDNSDGGLYPGMTTQVFFVTSSARNVLTVPLGALTFTGAPAGAGGGAMSGQGGRGGEDLAARAEQFRANGGELTPEMRQRMEQFRANGGAEGLSGRGAAGGRGGAAGGRGGAAGGFPGGGSPGGEFADGAAIEDEGPTVPRLAASIALNQPRNATVQLVQADGSTLVREVVVGASDRVNAEVISGLVEGDRVIAGVVQARVEEEEEQNNNSNNQWRGGGGFPGGGGFRPF